MYDNVWTCSTQDHVLIVYIHQGLPPCGDLQKSDGLGALICGTKGSQKPMPFLPRPFVERSDFSSLPSLCSTGPARLSCAQDQDFRGPWVPRTCRVYFLLISGQKGKTILKIMYFDAFLICFALYHWVLIMDRSSALNCLSSKWSYRTPTPPIIASFSRL